ncbi:MAG: hypothetical protein ACE5JS_19050 [Nitrospinota bacterium]
MEEEKDQQKVRDGQNMTAEIAILNKSAVALAADSKVTVGPEGSQKTYDTVNKLFALSKYHPIAAMIFGNAQFMGFPWETIIKLHREQISAQSQPTVFDYADRFFEDLLKGYSFTESDQKHNVSNILSSYYADIRRITLQTFTQTGKPYKKTFKLILQQVISAYHRQLSGLDKSECFENISEQDILKHYSVTINKAIMTAFKGVLSIDSRKLLRELSVNVLLKNAFSPSYSGVVFAGFGDDERFPSLAEYRTDGVIAGVIKKREGDRIDIRRTMGASVVAFAQRDIVYGFMEGVDPDYQRYLEGVVSELLKQNGLSILSKYGRGSVKQKDKHKQEVQDALKKKLEDFYKHMAEYRGEHFSREIIDMIVMLPKEEMANMAESLVNLTSLKRRMSFQTESVGGPIDVAVISKSDGLIWIKRKHYFRAEDNPMFFQNYFREKLPKS